MKLAQFQSWRTTVPNVTQLERPTQDFSIGDSGGTEWIDLSRNGTLIIIRRGRLPDLVFTPMGYGIMLDDPEAVPGNRSGNPVEEEPVDGRRRRR